ncbi:pyrimidine-nucleoside phosphorylase, partial [Staphylococcus aureus]|nr:pyrimidine-nucleoside phosphorylase [Staphylococcus aureus]
NSGAALEKFKTFIKNKGGYETVIEHPERLPQAQYQIEYKSKKSGYVTELDSNDIGVASMMFGAGRLTKEDDIDLAVG